VRSKLAKESKEELCSIFGERSGAGWILPVRRDLMGYTYDWGLFPGWRLLGDEGGLDIKEIIGYECVVSKKLYV
jgi:hypothetical protein